jgi:hypothetical protein
MGRKSVLMKNKVSAVEKVERVGVDISAMSWHEFRAFAVSHGVAVFGRGRAVIEADLIGKGVCGDV